MLVCDLEQAIMAMWSTQDDLELLYYAHGDRSPAMTNDEVANSLLGLISIHEMRSQKCFELFEKYVKEKNETQV